MISDSTSNDCVSGTPYEYATSTGSNWVKVTSPTVNTQAAVLVMIPGEQICSGVMVNDVTVLTAAHCVADEDGEFNAADFIVCTRGNLQVGAVCKAVTDIHSRVGNWAATDTLDHDIALLELASHPANTGALPMTQASDSVLDDYTQYLLGYPVWASPTCTYNIVAHGFGSPVVVGGYDGVYEWRSTGALIDSGATFLTFDINTGGGMSGGAQYYCPSGDCADGAWITSLHSARDADDNSVAYGSRAKDFRSWVIANLY